MTRTPQLLNVSMVSVLHVINLSLQLSIGLLNYQVLSQTLNPGCQGQGQPREGKRGTFPHSCIIFFHFPQCFLIFFLSLVLRMGSSPKLHLWFGFNIHPPVFLARVAYRSETCAILKHVSNWHCVSF